MKIEKYHKNHKAFLLAYKSINHGNEKLKSFFNDKRLTHVEKELLLCLLVIKKNKLKKAQQALESLVNLNSFLKCYHSMLLASVYNNQGEFIKAREEINAAIKGFHKLGDKKYVFYAYDSAASIYHNCKKICELESLMLQIESLPTEEEYKYTLHKKCQLFIILLRDESKEAIKISNELCQFYREKYPDHLGFGLMQLVVSYFKNESIEECYKVLSQYKKLGGYKIKANYKYTVSLLDLLYKGQRYYLYEKDFKDASLLYLELNVIISLVDEKPSQAKKAWNQLHQKLPHIYQKNYKLSSDKTFFSMAYDRYSQFMNDSAHELDLDKLASLEFPIQRLEYILYNFQGYISREKLISYIWDEEWTPSGDARLNRLIYKLKKKKDLNIKASKGRYKLAS